jgi:hypothetical protein
VRDGFDFSDIMFLTQVDATSVTQRLKLGG